MILRDDILSLFDYVATNKLSDQFLIGIRNLYKNDIEFDIVYSQFCSIMTIWKRQKNYPQSSQRAIGTIIESKNQI
jgi:hypothetical protein